MRRRTFNVIAACVWVCLFVVANVYLDLLVDVSRRILPELENLALPVLAVCAIVVGLATQTILADHYAPKVPPSDRDLTEAEKRKRAEREANLALKQGRKGTAMLIYEQAGMYTQAFNLAKELDDRPGMARLSVRLGHYARARRLYLHLRDYEAAAHTSVLMDEIDTAREYYRQAAEAGKGNLADAQEAGLWDRAGDRATAASLYEECGELERAAECYLVLGDRRNSVRCEEQAKALRAYERKQQSESRQVMERRAEEQRAAAAKEAKELEAQGDLLGAGILYREAELMVESAMAFERFEEWERAADAYERANLRDRAELARMHIETKEDLSGVDLQPAPAPGEAGEAAFVPIARAQAIPVYLGVGGAPPVSPEARLEVCRRVRRGNLLEAAEFAKAAGDWLMAAAYYENAGNYLAAADIYRQIGDVNAAAWCLNKAGRTREAAFMALAIGQNERALEFLLGAIESGQELRENWFTVAELLIQWGKYEQALDLLRKKIAPRGISEANAEVLYQFARRFEEQEAWKQAHAIYRDLISAGAESEDINEREARLAGLLMDSGQLEVEQEPEAREPDNIESMLNVALEELAGQPEEEEALVEEVGRTKVFQLAPGGESPFDAAGEAAVGRPAVALKTFMLPQQEMSLFGHAVGDPKPDDAADSDGQLLVATAQPGREAADLFAPRQRYEVKSELGRGGMGVVYETVDTVLARPVALKLILQESANPEGYGQFLVEARAIALLSHPNVVTIYDIGLMDLRHYIAMEFVNGGSLADLIKKEKTLSIKEALRIFIEISQGLQTAHEAGIVHRDVKPENILLTEKRQVKITDFGLASVRRAAKAERGKTPYAISGTPGFMAPEQLRGEEPHPRFDIYALGVTLFTMLVGKPPYEIANKTELLDIVAFQKSGEQLPLRRFRPNAPEAIEQLYQYCAAADPEERYQSIDAYLPAVEQIYSSLQ